MRTRLSAPHPMELPGSPILPARRGAAVLLFASLLVAGGCTLFGGLSEVEEAKLSVYLQQGISYYEGRRYRNAEQQARKALAIEKDHTVANLILGWSLVQQRNAFRLPEAQQVFEEMLDRGSVNYRTNYGLALTHYQRSLTELSRLDELKRWRTNRVAREEAARKRSKAPPTDEELEKMIAEADRQSEAHQVAALEQLDKVLELNPGYPHALLSKGQLQLLRGDQDGALKNFEFYLELAELTREKSLNPDQWIDSGMSTPERELVNQVIEEKIASNIKKDVKIRIEAANIHFRKGDYKAALAHLNKAIELDPHALLAYLNRAECYGELGEYDAAVRDLEVFVRKSDRDYDEVMKRASLLLAKYSRARSE